MLIILLNIVAFKFEMEPRIYSRCGNDEDLKSNEVASKYMNGTLVGNSKELGERRLKKADKNSIIIE